MGGAMDAPPAIGHGHCHHHGRPAGQMEAPSSEVDGARFFRYCSNPLPGVPSLRFVGAFSS